MNAPMRTQKRFFYFALFIALFVIVIPFIVLHSMGYSFTSDAPLRGGIYVFSPESGSKIYIDDELKDETGTFQKEFFVQNLKPQQYRVVVSHEDFRPWAKFVDVQEQKVAALYPLLIPNNVTVQEIVPATSTVTEIASTSIAYSELKIEAMLALFKPASTTKVVSTLLTTVPASSTSSTAASTTNALAATTTILTAKDFAVVSEDMSVWKDNREIFAAWTGNMDRIPQFFCLSGVCQPEIKVFEAAYPVRHIEFYPGRDDAVIIAVNKGVYALELDTRQFQTFVPLYEGLMPDFRLFEGQVIIKDKTYLGVCSNL